MNGSSSSKFIDDACKFMRQDRIEIQSSMAETLTQKNSSLVEVNVQN